MTRLIIKPKAQNRKQKHGQLVKSLATATFQKKISSNDF